MSNILTLADDHADRSGENHLVKELLAFAWGRMMSGTPDSVMRGSAFDSGIAEARFANTERRLPEPPTY